MKLIELEQQDLRHNNINSNFWINKGSYKSVFLDSTEQKFLRFGEWKRSKTPKNVCLVLVDVPDKATLDRQIDKLLEGCSGNVYIYLPFKHPHIKPNQPKAVCEDVNGTLIRDKRHRFWEYVHSVVRRN